MNYIATTPKFAGKNVPLMKIAQTTGKSAQFLSVRLLCGIVSLDLPK